MSKQPNLQNLNVYVTRKDTRLINRTGKMLDIISYKLKP